MSSVNLAEGSAEGAADEVGIGERACTVHQAEGGAVLSRFRATGTACEIRTVGTTLDTSRKGAYPTCSTFGQPRLREHEDPIVGALGRAGPWCGTRGRRPRCTPGCEAGTALPAGGACGAGFREILRFCPQALPPGGRCLLTGVRAGFDAELQEKR